MASCLAFELARPRGVGSKPISGPREGEGQAATSTPCRPSTPLAFEQRMGGRMKVRSQFTSFASVVSLVAGLLAVVGLSGQAAAPTEGQLSQGPIKRVISIVFDNSPYPPDRAH